MFFSSQRYGLVMHTLRQVLANHTLQMVQGNYILLILLKLYLFTSSVFDWNFCQKALLLDIFTSSVSD